MSLEDILIGGLSASFATLFTNPIDAMKIRMQMKGIVQNKEGSYSTFYRYNVRRQMYLVTKGSKCVALQVGLLPAMGYQMTLNGVRLGYFAYMEDKGRLQKEDGKLDISQNLMASSVGASLGTLVSNPLYLTKCRQQGKVAQQILEGKRLEYKGTWNIIKNIIQTQGVLGPYKGALPAMLITVYGSSIQLLTFQLTKREIDKVAWIPEGYASFGSAAMAGLVLTVAMLPFDVVVSRFIIQPRDEKGMGILYRNYKEVCEVVFRHEGISGFLRGFLLSYLKNGPHTFILLFTWDLVRAYQRFLN